MLSVISIINEGYFNTRICYSNKLDIFVANKAK